MDRARFDALARALGGGMSRRAALAAALASLPAAGALAQDDDPAAAKKKRKRCRKDSPEGQCCTDGKGCRCDNGGVACAAECCPAGTACIEAACAAGGCRWESGFHTWKGQQVFGLTGDFLELNLFGGVEADGVVMWGSRETTSADWTWRKIGSKGSRPDQFGVIQGIAVNAAGTELLVSQVYLGRISVWKRPDAASAAWTAVATFGATGPEAERLVQPMGVALTADTLTAFVAERAAVSIWRRSSTDRQDWTLVKRLGSGARRCGLGSFDSPYGVALGAGNLALFVTDCDKVQVWTRPDQASDAWTPVAELSDYLQGRLASALGISAAGYEARSFWVADAKAARVLEWVARDDSLTRWMVRTVIGSQGTNPGQFLDPEEVHAGVSGTLWIADNPGQRPEDRQIQTWAECGG